MAGQCWRACAVARLPPGVRAAAAAGGQAEPWFSVAQALARPPTGGAAVAVAAMEKARATGELEGPVIALSTAHPAKFPDAVEQATGVRPAIPPHVGDLFAQAERYETAPADIELIKSAIETARGR